MPFDGQDDRDLGSEFLAQVSEWNSLFVANSIEFGLARAVTEVDDSLRQLTIVLHPITDEQLLEHQWGVVDDIDVGARLHSGNACEGYNNVSIT